MSGLDKEVEGRAVELRAEGKAEEERERNELESMRAATEAFAERIDRRVASRRLAFNVIAADEALDSFARFVIEVRHRRTDSVLGHVLQRDVGMMTSSLPEEGAAPPTTGTRIASFFAPLVLYRECDFDGYACETLEEIDPRQLDEASFVDWLYDELVELTAVHEQEFRG